MAALARSVRAQRSFAEGVLRSARAVAFDADVLAQTRESRDHQADSILRRSAAGYQARRAARNGRHGDTHRATERCAAGALAGHGPEVAGAAAARAGDGRVFALNRTTRVFRQVGATDLRLGFDGLYGQVVSILRQDVLLCIGQQYVALHRDHQDLPGDRSRCRHIIIGFHFPQDRGSPPARTTGGSGHVGALFQVSPGDRAIPPRCSRQ